MHWKLRRRGCDGRHDELSRRAGFSPRGPEGNAARPSPPNSRILHGRPERAYRYPCGSRERSAPHQMAVPPHGSSSTTARPPSSGRTGSLGPARRDGGPSPLRPCVLWARRLFDPRPHLRPLGRIDSAPRRCSSRSKVWTSGRSRRGGRWSSPSRMRSWMSGASPSSAPAAVVDLAGVCCTVGFSFS